MGVDSDFSDVEDFFEEEKKGVIANEELVGREAVQYAIESGSYKDHTGKLRSSNGAEADESGLILKNDTPYASYVESKGYDVLSGAALEAEARLKEIFE